jgi:hypothetical protein
MKNAHENIKKKYSFNGEAIDSKTSLNKGALKSAKPTKLNTT